jgi:predicted nucleic acid-binding protein
MIHAFIDTNVYLTFFSFTEEDLEELRKLLVAIKNGDLKLWTTPQVADELRRNREAKVADSLDRLKKLAPSQAIPQMALNLPDFGEFIEAKRAFEGHVSTLHTQLSEQATAGTLAADAVLGELLEAAESVPITDDIIEAARRRVEVGNPPGKKGSLGDALNWEALLKKACPWGEDLHLVTADADFVSKMSKDKVSSFLAHEWVRAKKSQIHLHRSISGFLRDHFPDIKVASEFEKELRVRRLVESGAFVTTHSAIAKLAGYTDYSNQQAQDLLEAAIANSQIRSIARDRDVHLFFTNLGRRYGDLLDDDLKDEFGAIFFGDEIEAAEADERYYDDDDDEPSSMSSPKSGRKGRPPRSATTFT